MTEAFLEIAGKIFPDSQYEVAVDLTVQIYGGPYSIRLASEQGISLEKVWEALSQKLDEYIGISLPDLSSGPWSSLVGIDSSTTVTPMLYVGPVETGGAKKDKTTAYVGLDLNPPIRIGGSKPVGPFNIVLTPEVTIHAMYLSYDDGLDFRLKISTPTTTGVSPNPAGMLEATAGADKFQIVTYPFPIPAQKSTATKAFEFKYLGLGQRVGPDPAVNVDDPMETIFAQLESQFTATDPKTILTDLAANFYHPDRNWFVAAHVVIVGWDIKLLFNDPAMYGLRISVPYVPITPFAGLLFEILYQKLGPNLGVYYGALTLPYLMRRIVLQGIILILPGFAIWIYTNGDFRVNVGWPLGDSSIGIQVGVLVGIAGFYFAKLRSGDNPGVQSSVNYNPILLFGIGMSLYVKQGFNASIFSATIAVSVTATLQGLLAWVADQPTSGAPNHYWFAGTAGLSVLIEGSVDFSILKASVTISLQALVTVAFETGYATVIAVSASVSVSVRIKVIFFTISLSFSTSIHHQFVIGSGPYASVAGPLDPDLAPFVTPAISARHLEARRTALTLMADFAVHRGPRMAWRAGRRAMAAAEPAQIDLYFLLQPTAIFTGEQPGFACVATLFVEAPEPGVSGPVTAFEHLVRSLVHWLYDGYSDPDLSVATRLEEIANELGAGSQMPGPAFHGLKGFAAELREFLQSSLAFRIHGVDSEGKAPFHGPSAVLPMFDSLTLTYPVAGSPDTATIDFSSYNRTPENYPSAVTMYFEGLAWSGSESLAKEMRPRQTRAGAFTGPSMASYLMTDYFLMLARQVIAELRDAARDREVQEERHFFRRLDEVGTGSLRSVGVVSDYVSQVAGDEPLNALFDGFNYASAAGLGSRFLLNGLQLPDPALVPSQPTPENMRDVPTSGLYVLTGQQFAVASGVTEVVASLGEGATYIAPAAMGARLTFPAGLHLAVATGSPFQARLGLPSEVPPMPAPAWQVALEPPPALDPDVVTLSMLPPLSAHALYFSLKNQVAWAPAAADSGRTLLPLPPQLMDRLSGGQMLQLGVTKAAPAEHLTMRPALAAELDVHATPSLLIRMTLSQVPAESVGRVTSSGSPAAGSPGTQSKKFLPFVYQIGGTDEQTRDLIYAALMQDLEDASISILYAVPGTNGLESEELSATTLVAKTNLSTVNQAQTAGPVHLLRMLAADAAPVEYASVMDVKNFLRLLWEVSVVNAAGYFLFYQGADGQDLPSSLFQNAGTEGNAGEFQVLVTFGRPSSRPQLQAWQNTVWLAQPPGTGTLFGAVYTETGDPVPQWGPTYPAGDLGFKVEWSRTDASPAPPIDVDQLYQLLQYAVLPGNGYVGSNWSLPAGPANPEPDTMQKVVRATEDWVYTKTLPVSAFYAGNSPDNANRYAIMGNAVSTGFRFDDIFGNALPISQELATTPLYNDPLIGLGEWPGVQVHYQVVGGDSISGTLEVKAVFDPESLTPQLASPPASPDAPVGDTAVQQWQAVLNRYDLILDQISDPNTNASLTCSLSGAPVIEPAKFQSEMEQFARAIRVQVQIALAGASPAWGHGSAAEAVNKTFAGALPFADVRALPDDVTKLWVSIELSRDLSLIDRTVMERMPSVAKIAYAPAPDLHMQLGSPSGSPNKTPGLSAFAQMFEDAFLGFDGGGGSLKLAQSSGLQTSQESSDLKPLWVVRWSANSGLSVKFDGNRIVYFALRPLSQSLINNTSRATGLVYSNVDLDAWAYAFVRAFDSFMQPRNAVAVAVLDNRNGTDYFNRLLQAKSRLSQSIPKGVTNLLKGQLAEGDLAAARESLGQSLLTALSNTFSVSTILQAPASVTTGSKAPGSPSAQPPQLWGAVGPPQGGSAAPKQYNLSNGELKLASGEQWMTVLVSVQEAKAQSELLLPISYQVSYLQDGMQKEVNGYVASSWMKFVLDADPRLQMQVSKTPAQIPIPLPFYPELPRLVQQIAAAAPLVSPAHGASPDDVESEIAAALRWDYTVSIEHDWAAQDELFFTVQFNLPAASYVKAMLEEPWSLFDALSYFLQQYAQIEEQISSIAAEAYPHAKSVSPGCAEQVVNTFTHAVESVQKAWEGFWAEGPTAMLFGGSSDVLTDNFYIAVEMGGSPEGLTVYVFGATDEGGNPAFWPSIGLANGASWTPDRSQATLSSSPGVWWQLDYTFAGCSLADIRRLNLYWEELDVLTRQTATLSAKVVRNANLLLDSSKLTNPDFVFQTAEVKFPGPVVPLIQRASLAPVLPASSLTATIEQILTPMVRLASGMNPSLRIGATYEYALAPGLPASIAVLLADGVQLGESGSPMPLIARDLAEELGVWHDRVGPSTTGALLVLSISVFGTIQGDRLPLVQIGRIPVVVADVGAGWWS